MTVKQAVNRGGRSFQEAMGAPRYRETDDEAPGALIVKATEMGFYGTRRRAGAEFALKDRADFSHTWMKAVGWDPGPAPRKKARTTGFPTFKALEARVLSLEKRMAEVEGAPAEKKTANKKTE
jgi:hypothetical protein